MPDWYKNEMKIFKTMPNICLQKSKILRFYSKVTLKTPKSDQHLISPYSYTAESFIKIMRIKEMIANLRSFDCKPEFSLSVPKEMYRKEDVKV